jgi:hypothetical protein
MITNKTIKDLFNEDGQFIYGDKIVSYELDETFMDCYISVFDTITKNEQRILFSECVAKTTDIFSKKFCDTVAEKLNNILEK